MNDFTRNAPTVSNQHMNHGAVAIEQSRAITEAQGKLLLAKQFPRDENTAYQKLMASCSRQTLAQHAVYSFPRGKEQVSGPSIRLAEEIARLYGNIEYGIRELSNTNGESEMEAFAWDLETNVVSSQKFKVKHERKAYGKMQTLTDTRDIYELTANMGARRLRARLLSILPPEFVEAAVEECRKTLSGNNQTPIADRIRGMITAFAKYGVTKEMIEVRLEHSVDAIDPNELTDLMGIFNSIKNGQSGRADWFEFENKIPETKSVEVKSGFSKADKPAKQEPKQDPKQPKQPEQPTTDQPNEIDEF